MTFKEKCTNKSIYVVPPLAALIKIRSWGAPILFFVAWCTQNLISLTTTDSQLLYNACARLTTKLIDCNMKKILFNITFVTV